MKKIIAIVMTLVLVFSMTAYAVAEVLSIEEMKAKLNEYNEFLEGEWQVEGGQSNITIRKNDDKLSISCTGQLYIDQSFMRQNATVDGGEITFTADDNRIKVVSNPVAGVQVMITLVRQ